MTRTQRCVLFLLVFNCMHQFGQAQTLTAEQVVGNPELVHARMRLANPDYRDQGRFELDPDLELVGDFTGGGVTDISPLNGLPFGALDLKAQHISDLTPLKGMQLRLLGVEETGVSDLRPLSGMRLEKVYLNATIVSDLQPLAGMPITELMLVETLTKDLRPLHGIPLQQLWLNDTPVQDISPLKDCPLVSLTLEGTNVSDLRPLSGMTSLERLHIGGTNVTDLTPLKGLRLKRLIFTPSHIKVGLGIVKGMKSLTEIGTTLDGRMLPKQFWPLYEKGQIK